MYIHRYVNKDMQMYVDINVLETVRIFIFSFVWEAVSFHGEEQHIPTDQRGEPHD